MAENPTNNAPSAPDARQQAIRDAVAEARQVGRERQLAPVPTAENVRTGASQTDTVQASRDSITAELARARQLPAEADRSSPITNAPLAEPLIRNGPPDGPLIKTDPAISPAGALLAANAMKVCGEVRSDRIEGHAVKAAGHALEAVATAEPGTTKRAVVAQATYAAGADWGKGKADVEGPDPSIDRTIDRSARRSRARPNCSGPTGRPPMTTTRRR